MRLWGLARSVATLGWCFIGFPLCDLGAKPSVSAPFAPEALLQRTLWDGNGGASELIILMRRALGDLFLVAVELARRMVATAHDNTERGNATNLLGNALTRLGVRESGTARFDLIQADLNAITEC